MRITTTFFICHNLAISLFNKMYFSIFSCFLSHTFVSAGIATSIIIISFFTLSTTTISGSCSYQSLALLNPSFSQNCQCTLSCLRLYSFVLVLVKFVTFTHDMRYSLISCSTHPTKG